MNHRVGRNLFGLVVGLGVAILAYQWISDPQPRAQRAQEEQAVHAARQLLSAAVEADALEIVDPLAPNRKVGKVYVYEEPPGWAVSGYYRRSDADRWHPFLLTMNGAFELQGLKVKDAAMAGRAGESPLIEIVP